MFSKRNRKNYKNFNNIVKADGINIDYEIDPLWAKQNLKNVVLQGGLDPKILLLSEQEIKIMRLNILIFSKTFHIFLI